MKAPSPREISSAISWAFWKVYDVKSDVIQMGGAGLSPGPTRGTPALCGRCSGQTRRISTSDRHWMVRQTNKYCKKNTKRSIDIGARYETWWVLNIMTNNYVINLELLGMKRKDCVDKLDSHFKLFRGNSIESFTFGQNVPIFTQN